MTKLYVDEKNVVEMLEYHYQFENEEDLHEAKR